MFNCNKTKTLPTTDSKSQNGAKCNLIVVTLFFLFF